MGSAERGRPCPPQAPEPGVLSPWKPVLSPPRSLLLIYRGVITVRQQLPPGPPPPTDIASSRGHTEKVVPCLAVPISASLLVSLTESLLAQVWVPTRRWPSCLGCPCLEPQTL